MMDSLSNLILYIVSIVFGIFVVLLVLWLLRNYGNEKDAFQKRLNKISGTKNGTDYLNDSSNKSFTERVLKPTADKVYDVIRMISRQSSGDDSTNDQRNLKLKATLRQAGSKMSVGEYQTMRLILIPGVGVIVGILAFVISRGVGIALIFFLVAMLGTYVVLRFLLASRATTRKQKIQTQLPEVLDMISVSVEAGLGLEQAMIEVVKHFEGPLIDEIAITNREMAMGRARNDALELLATRCDSDDVQSFTRAIIQATEMGIAVKNVLRSQSEYMRQTHKNKVEEKAMKVSVKILFPMVIFILPVIMIVLLGPAAMSAIQSL
jgi:tight adherence protein C